MSAHDHPSVEYLRQCFQYKDGRLFWKERPRDHFTTERAYRTCLGRDAGKEAGTISSHKEPRCVIWINGKQYYRYSVVWSLHHGEWIKNIDHKDGNQLNDKINNLRPSTKSQNAANSKRRSDNTSGYKGVSFDKQVGRWTSCIWVNNKRIILGRFPTAKDAHEAYVQAAREHFGEFAHDGVQPVLPITDSSSSMSKSNFS